MLTQKMQLHFLANAIPPPVPLTDGDRGRLRQNWLSKYSHTLRGMRRFCPASFSLSLAQILRLTRKIKTKCIFRVKEKTIYKKTVLSKPFHSNYSNSLFRIPCITAYN